LAEQRISEHNVKTKNTADNKSHAKKREKKI